MKRILLFFIILTLLPSLCFAEVSFLFVNVGKADAALIRCNDYTALVDCGTKDSFPNLLKALQQSGVSSVDEVFFSHSHDDHTGGFKKLCKQVSVSRFYHSIFTELNDKENDFFQKLSEKTGVPHETLSAGTLLTPCDELTIEVLAPERASSDYNDQSLVLRFSAYGRSVLFTGDMQFTEEFYLMRSVSDLNADVLKIGNHGNPDASSEGFLRAVSPSIAVISTDTVKDPDSANSRITGFLSEKLSCKVYLTQDYETGVRIVLHEDGTVSVD